MQRALRIPARLLLSVGLMLGALVGCSGGDGGGTGRDRPAAAGRAGAPESAGTAGRTPPGPLEPRMQFPAVNVLTLQGERTNTHALLRKEDSVVIFMQIGCESCEEVVAVWKRLADTVPDGMNVFAVIEEDPPFAAGYAEETGFPFPLYCDDEGIFNTEYKVGVFPTMVGVTGDGRIAYIGKPVTPEFTPVEAWKMLMDIKEKREKAGI